MPIKTLGLTVRLALNLAAILLPPLNCLIDIPPTMLSSFHPETPAITAYEVERYRLRDISVWRVKFER